MPTSGLKAQLCKGIINHRPRCGKQQAKAMLVQRCPPCLLVKGTDASHWIRLMCARYLLVNNITSLENSQCVLTERKTNAVRAKGKLPCYLSNSTAQEDLCTQYCLFAEWESARHIVCQVQFIKLFCAVYIDCQCPHTREKIKKKSQQRYSHRRSIKVCQK